MRTPIRAIGRRLRGYRYLVLAVAAILLIATLVLRLTHADRHLGWSGWLSIGLFAAAFVTMAIAARPRHAGGRQRGTAGAGSTSSAPKSLELTGTVLGIVSSILSIIASFLTFAGAPSAGATAPASPPPSQPAPPRDPCATSLGGPPHIASLSNGAYQSIDPVKEIRYSVYSDDTNPVTAQEHTAFYGFMLGAIQRGDAIYAISQFDHKTRSKITNQPGYDKVIYVRGPVHVEANGCLSLASTNLGEPKTFGISEKITLLVVNQAQARVLRNTQIAVDEGRGSSLAPGKLPDLGVPLASFEFSTDPYDVPDGHGGWVTIARLRNSLDLARLNRTR